MTVDGKKIGATAMLADQNALRRRKEQLEETARKKEEGQKQAVHILTTAMEKGTSMEEARTAANDLLAALSEEIVSDCMSRARDHISDILEQNQKKADEIAEKKRKKEEQKQRREEREAIRKRKLVLKRVLVPVTQAGDGALDEVPCDPIDEGSPDEAYLVGAATNESGRTIDLPLSFLEKGNYTVEVIEDGDDAHYLTNRESLKVTTRQLTSNDKLALKLAPGGGACLVIKKNP